MNTEDEVLAPCKYTDVPHSRRATSPPRAPKAPPQPLCPSLAPATAASAIPRVGPCDRPCVLPPRDPRLAYRDLSSWASWCRAPVSYTARYLTATSWQQGAQGHRCVVGHIQSDRARGDVERAIAASGDTRWCGCVSKVHVQHLHSRPWLLRYPAVRPCECHSRLHVRFCSVPSRRERAGRASPPHLHPDQSAS